MTLKQKMQTQAAEFHAASQFAKQVRRHELTAVVDDDYPAVRADYERALMALLACCKANGRSV